MISAPPENLLPHSGVGVERIAGLVDIGQIDRVAVFERACVGLFLAGQHSEQGGFAGAVRADHADDAAGGQGEAQVFDQQAVAIALLEVLDLDDLLAQPRAVRDNDLSARDFLALGLVSARSS